MVTYCGMNIIEYINFLMTEYGLTEIDAEMQASCDFDLMEE